MVSPALNGARLDDHGNPMPFSGPVLLTTNGVDPLSYANDEVNPLYTSAFYNPVGVATSAHWQVPVLTDKVADVYLARSIQENQLSKELSGQTVLRKKFNLPVVSLIMDNRDLFHPEQGIYVQGNDWHSNKGNDSFEPWFMRKGNYSRRGLEGEKPAFIQFFTADGNSYFSDQVGVRIHGNATRSYPQKSLRIVAGKDPIVDPWGGEVQSLILRNGGNSWETTMIGDLLAQRIARGAGLLQQRGEPCVLLINGYYWGLHNIRDRLKVENIALIKECEPADVSIWENWEFDKGNPKRGGNLSTLIQQIRNEEQLTYKDISKELDVKEFARYILIETFMGNADWPQNNFAMFKIRKGKWHPILSDLDYALGYNSIIHPSENCLERLINSSSLPQLLFTELMKHKKFREVVKKAYNDLEEEGVFDPVSFNRELTALKTTIGSEIPNQIKRWRELKSYEHWEHELKKMEEFYVGRTKYFKEHLNQLVTVK